MSELAVDAPKVVEAFNGGLTWLNRKSNSLQKFQLDKILSAKEEANGELIIESNLKMFNKDHHFRFVIDTSLAPTSPEYLKDFKQLSP
ncbi:hypothetical protein TVAG_198300 [Trichomonas vaginalis G3]|uniref:Uncharacterized protein n=1 Tax=Trichomonas vaginalis (strain ATCC PRA-98 / G3) TaxID=412133 RepID=A2DDL6_TRIV3|nr:hypothetical protein TVAGG3_0998720 [Trichomonas vaginalis G3]EAY21392.1 hypothetical protein TVAG_198300 [Trichomonas vaginalis G3]KAI5490605.1 hypothetical protein TVAGG3_0998720 [Trichomonas vaginalis G3]|eukprot:XP_001582378.1 hypothetical protein [Trichomonas vaginalis G3]